MERKSNSDWFQYLKRLFFFLFVSFWCVFKFTLQNISTELHTSMKYKWKINTLLRSSAFLFCFCFFSYRCLTCFEIFFERTIII